MLSVIMLSVIMLSVIMLSVIMLSVIMLTVICSAQYHNAECNFIECHYSEYSFSGCHYAECQYTYCHYQNAITSSVTAPCCIFFVTKKVLNGSLVTRFMPFEVILHFKRLLEPKWLLWKPQPSTKTIRLYFL